MRIAFGYKMGCGKDTAVDYLIHKHGGNKISFSEPLYDMMYYCQTICGFKPKKDRKFLQWIGTEWAREQNKNVWIDVLLTKVENYSNRGYKNIFVSDVRFKNEFQALKNNGWICVKIVKDNTDNRLGNGYINHSSENELDMLDADEWSYVITNNGTLEEFYDTLDRLYKKINN